MVSETKTASLPTHDAYPAPGDVDVRSTAEAFLEQLAGALQGDAEAFADLILPEGYWRDVLAFTRDFRTIEATSVAEVAKAVLPKNKAKAFVLSTTTPPALESPFPDVTWLRLHFNFETALGKCTGIARIVKAGDSWRAYTVYTLLEEIHGWPQAVGRNRPYGKHNDREPHAVRRARETEFKDKDPDVLIIGGGHNGLGCSAVLRSFGVTSLVVDRFENVGDNWAKRYASLSLHDPVWTDHMPLMEYPPNWPVFMQAGKLATWLQAYAEAQEVNIWLQSTVDPAKTRFNSATQQWELTILRNVDGKIVPRDVKVSHVIMATGLGGGKPKFPPAFPGQAEWPGTVVHSSQHKGGKEWHGKRALVVGACTSGHDISVDLVNNGVDTTMLQRSPTFIMSIDKGLPLLDSGLFTEANLENMSVETADRIADSMPKQVAKLFHQRIVKHLAVEDKEILDGLKAAGFKTYPGPEGSGWLFLAYERAGGYYFTAGEGSGSDMIAKGKIKVKGGEIRTFNGDGSITFTDGDKQKFDLVIFATGYTGFPDTVRETLGPAAVDKLGKIWGLDQELEVNGVARDAGLPRVFFTVGNFMMSRWFSRRIALQVIAQREGKWD
ncbi:uncharacterized protein COLE_01468 [Cutaneotrichosporon oleaginosum]|uniref:uncharacterized protein n=1 Tax=Cutaneotrichosporon oleaginosum TaxID=879819 RepID=UPI00132AC17F|nr:hypothetical protein COLE_01468 [Cutaneotrichosporon oleaginosum]